MRVTDANRYDQLRAQLLRTSNDLGRASERLTTGRVINRLSDDPDRAVLADRLRSESEALETYARAADNARAWLGTQDSALQTGTSIMQRIRELTVTAASSQAPGVAEGLASEIEALRAQLVEVANTRFNGRSVFGGFADHAVDDSGAAATFVGDNGEVRRRVSETLTVTVNISGADAFGFTSGDDVFAVLDDLVDAIRSGDTATVGGTGLQRLQDRFRDMTQALGAVGSRTNGVESSMVAGTARRDEIRAYRSSIVDADLAETAIELTLAETAYEAVLAATARLQQPSLVDYLR